MYERKGIECLLPGEWNMRRIRHDYRRIFYFGKDDVRHTLLSSLEAMEFAGKSDLIRMKGELTRRYGDVLIDGHPNLEPRLRMGGVMHVVLPVPS